MFFNFLIKDIHMSKLKKLLFLKVNLNTYVIYLLKYTLILL